MPFLRLGVVSVETLARVLHGYASAKYRDFNREPFHVQDGYRRDAVRFAEDLVISRILNFELREIFMPEQNEAPEQSRDIYPMNIATLANFQEMQQNMAESLDVLVRNSGNPGTRATAEALLKKVRANIEKVSEWIAARQ